MQEVSEGIKSYPIDKFVITKSLTKAPQQYGDANAQPHVKVALEMIKQGRHVSVGDHIPYVVCQVEGGSLADKAFHPYSPDLASGKVQLDIEWYLSHQILPPISRICEPIDGVDIRRLAISLGLDASKFSSESRESNNPASVVDDSFAFDLYDFDDEEVFKGLAKIELTCQHCLQKSPFLGMCSGINDKGEIIDGLQCPTAGCKGFLCDRKDMEMLRNSVFMLIKKSLSKFYQKVYVCDDLNCPLRFGTRRIPRRAGSHCFRTGCSGKLYPECSRDYVYKQIRYLQAVFDESRIKKKAQKSNFNSFHVFVFPNHFSEKVSLPAKQYPQGIREEILHIKKKIDDLLLQCSQHWIDPIALFTSSFATKVEIF
jgi:DNA polymerase alpha subunit A